MVRLRTGTLGMRICFCAVLMLCTAAGSGICNQDLGEVSVAPQILQQFVGVYELAPGFKLAVTVEGGQLMVQASGQPKLPVFASSETKFFYKVVNAQIEFVKDAAGVVTSLVLHQNNRDMPAPRISTVVAERKEISVPPSVLSQYAGTYELRPGFDLVISVEGDKLMSQATGQGKAQLFGESETKFFLKVTDAQVEFYKNDKGTVTHLMLHQGQAEVKALRK